MREIEVEKPAQYVIAYDEAVRLRKCEAMLKELVEAGHWRRVIFTERRHLAGKLYSEYLAEEDAALWQKAEALVRGEK